MYYSEIGPLEDAEAVNEWVSQRTNGKIEKLLDQLSADTKFLLTNVVYFHDTWTASFLEVLRFESFDSFIDPNPELQKG